MPPARPSWRSASRWPPTRPSSCSPACRCHQSNRRREVAHRCIPSDGRFRRPNGCAGDSSFWLRRHAVVRHPSIVARPVDHAPACQRACTDSCRSHSRYRCGDAGSQTSDGDVLCVRLAVASGMAGSPLSSSERRRPFCCVSSSSRSRASRTSAIRSIPSGGSAGPLISCRSIPAHTVRRQYLHPAVRTRAYADTMLLPTLMAAPAVWLGAPLTVVYTSLILFAFVAAGSRCSRSRAR